MPFIRGVSKVVEVLLMVSNQVPFFRFAGSRNADFEIRLYLLFYVKLPKNGRIVSHHLWTG